MLEIVLFAEENNSMFMVSWRATKMGNNIGAPRVNTTDGCLARALLGEKGKGKNDPYGGRG